MALLVILAGGIFHGDADDASVFGVFLLGGALLGAAGGALAVSGQAPADGLGPSSS
jgi:fructose-specific phosphotransferase system IIC component